MKKTLSIVLSIVMLLSITAGIDFSAYAATKYENSVITSNIKSIKKFIKENGFINGSGDYTFQEYSKGTDFDFYDLMIYDADEDTLLFKEQMFDVANDIIFGYVDLQIEPPTSSVMYVSTQYWTHREFYSDLGGHAYIDREYNHNDDYANFYIDFNDYEYDKNQTYDLFDALLCSGFESWDLMLQEYMGMNMGAVGFHSYCTDHSYKNVTTKATTTANGKTVKACKICGAISSTKTIAKASSIKLSATSYTYDGKVKTPSVTVKDSNGKTLVKNTDYTVSYASGRKNVGKYAVKITFKGNYSGTKTLYFTIKPKGTSISSVSAQSKAFTVKWKKQATQTTGYQIQYATDSKFTKGVKTVTVSKNSTTSSKVSKLTGNKKYYIRVRTYKTVSGTKYYSSWSGAKNITTMK